MRFENKVVIVTGSSSGMGRATAVGFAKEGAKVVVTSDKNIAGGEETVRMIKDNGGEAVYIRTDVSNEDDVINLINKTVEVYGRLDVLVNNAAVTLGSASVENIETSTWDLGFAVNVRGVFLCTKYAVPAMRANDGGSIINIASVFGERARGGECAYSSSKAAVMTFTKSVAQDLGPEIRVNCVAPGLTATPMTAVMPDVIRDFVNNKRAMKRMGQPEDIAKAIMFLASEDASFITGAVLPCDGGEGLVCISM